MKCTLSQLFLVITAISFIHCKSGTSLFIDNYNWQIGGEASWQFDQEMIIGEADGKAGFMTTSDTYDDFTLELEFYPSAGINSGVFIRCEDFNMSPTTCYELNIWDNHKNQEFRTGAIVMKSKPMALVNTIGKWNIYKIKAKEDRIQAWINGKKVADLTDQSRPTGHIGLQAAENGMIKFRKVTIKEL